MYFLVFGCLLRISVIEEDLEYFLVSKMQILIPYKLGDLAILQKYQFLTFRMDAHFSLKNQPLRIEGVVEDLKPMVQSMSSNSIEARRYHDFAWTLISGHLIAVVGRLVASQCSRMICKPFWLV